MRRGYQDNFGIVFIESIAVILFLSIFSLSCVSYYIAYEQYYRLNSYLTYRLFELDSSTGTKQEEVVKEKVTELYLEITEYLNKNQLIKQFDLQYALIDESRNVIIDSTTAEDLAFQDSEENHFQRKSIILKEQHQPETFLLSMRLLYQPVYLSIMKYFGKTSWFKLEQQIRIISSI